MKRSFSVFILIAFFAGSILAASDVPVGSGSTTVPPTNPFQPFPRIILASSVNQAFSPVLC